MGGCRVIVEKTTRKLSLPEEKRNSLSTWSLFIAFPFPAQDYKYENLLDEIVKIKQ